MKRMKWILGMFCCICCLLYAIPVRADVIWEPEDSFYQKHASDCTYVNRQFTANGPDGKVIVYISPEMPIAVETWENGTREWISFIYMDKDGIEWGYCDGWMPMEYMEVVYDSISFEEEYTSQITQESGDLDAKYQGKEINCWGYPGAETYYTLTVDGGYGPSYNSVFIDEEGNRWGKVGYYFGRKNFWLCLDRPEAGYEELYPNGGPQRGSGSAGSEEGTDSEDGFQKDEEGYQKEQGVSQEAENISQSGNGTSQSNKNISRRIVPKVNGKTVAIAVAMVALVAAVTAALLIGLRKKRK